jgi:hypothetical protein
MRFQIQLTHTRGVPLARDAFACAAPTVSGEVLLWHRKNDNGVCLVAEAIDDQRQSLCKLFHTEIVGIGTYNLRLRGLERIPTEEGWAWVTQGWLCYHVT